MPNVRKKHHFFLQRNVILDVYFYEYQQYLEFNSSKLNLFLFWLIIWNTCSLEMTPKFINPLNSLIISFQRTSTSVEMPPPQRCRTTVIFHTTAQTRQFGAAARAAVLTAFALLVMYSYFIFWLVIAHHRAWTYVSSAENISSHQFCCFTSDRVNPVSEQSFPKFEFGSPSVPALKGRKRRKTGKKPKLAEVHVVAAQKVTSEWPENCLKRIRFALLLCSSKPQYYNIILHYFTLLLYYVSFCFCDGWGPEGE